MDGIELCARFSLATSRLQYCGPSGADQLLYRAATGSQELDDARRALSGFEALMPYLETIGSKHSLDPFDAKVVEAYWIGNELLDAFDRSDFAALLERLVRRGLPRSLARSLEEHLPAHPIPHHAFHVSYVGVGNVTGHVETTLANMEACRPGYGSVRSVNAGKLTYDGPPLVWEDGRLGLGRVRRATAEADPRIIGPLEPGDPVATHWSTATVRLTQAQFAAIRLYTERSLAAANEAGVFGTEGSRSVRP